MSNDKAIESARATYEKATASAQATYVKAHCAGSVTERTEHKNVKMVAAVAVV
jgi:hypothetical protein